MVSAGTPMPARTLTKIIGGILTTTNSYSDFDTIKKQLDKLKGYRTLDMGCFCDSGSFYVDYEEMIPTPEEIDSMFCKIKIICVKVHVFF